MNKMKTKKNHATKIKNMKRERERERERDRQTDRQTDRDRDRERQRERQREREREREREFCRTQQTSLTRVPIRGVNFTAEP